MDVPHHNLTLEQLSIDAIIALEKNNTHFALSAEVIERVRHCHSFLSQYLQDNQSALYGINTGFGALCNVRIPDHDLSTLQHNLLMSHACGTGEIVPYHISRRMLLLKVHSFAYGHSAVRLEILELLLQLYNHQLTPIVYTIGSLGASGDLAPLAHLSLPLIGLGELTDANGQTLPGKQALAQIGASPMTLGPKEGLALLNGTQFMSSYGVEAVHRAQQLLQWANAIAALSTEAFQGRREPFAPQLQAIRPHPGQAWAASQVRFWLADSPIARLAPQGVQEPYSFRCVPQVHGTAYDNVQYTQHVVETEINGVSDNPNIFPDEGLILTGGNFHGQAIAVALDTLSLVMAQVAAMSERRTYQLQSGQRGLPLFLAGNPGVESGLMILQYTAAAWINQIKHLAHPHSLDSIPSSNGQEDYVSMGANAAVKTLALLNGVEQVLAIELIHAAQAMFIKQSANKAYITSPRLQSLLEAYWANVAPQTNDQVLAPVIPATTAFMASFALPTIQSE
jgi:histidine ammonia-lyase